MFPLKDNIPTRRFPVITVAIIVLNVLVFFGFQEATLSLSGASVDDQKVVEYGVIPYELTNPGDECGVTPDGQVACEGQPGVSGSAPEQAPFWVTLFTSMFMHGGLLHIIGNMLFLWIFGNNVEDSMGRAKFVAFYLLGGIAAVAAQTAIDPDAAIPTIGASGAVAAVLGGYALLYPRARVLTLIFIVIFFTVIELSALVVLGLWFLLQVFYGAADLAQPVGGGGVAYFAHIGGFVFGLLLIKLFADRQQDDYDRSNRIPVY
ncbi:MAG: rhomboid family intramembrane serine protease [Thermoleophilaceae bacterium]